MQSRAADKVPGLAASLDAPIDPATVELATELAERAEWDHPINRTPRGIAAGALYLAALQNGAHVSQRAIRDGTGIHMHTTRQAAREIAAAEGLDDLLP